MKVNTATALPSLQNSWACRSVSIVKFAVCTQATSYNRALMWYTAVKCRPMELIKSVSLFFDNCLSCGDYTSSNENWKRLGYSSIVLHLVELSLPKLRLFLISWGRVTLSPLGTSATDWPILPAPDNRWIWSICWNEDWQGKPKYSEKICPSATLYTTNPTWHELESNPGRGGKPVANSLICGTS
jgi:hypothetical protein